MPCNSQPPISAFAAPCKLPKTALPWPMGSEYEKLLTNRYFWS